MSAQVIPFIYNDKPVRSVHVDGNPWFVGKDVCGVLDIRDHGQAIERLDEDERGGCIVPTPRGEQEMIIISEPGVYRLVFTSRKPEAEQFKRWLAHEVLPQLRRTGKYAPGAEDEAPGADDVKQKLDLVREGRIIFGKERAAALWQMLGLPAVPRPYPLDHMEPYEAVAHALRAGLDGRTVREALGAAMERRGRDEALERIGVKPLHHGQRFAIAGSHTFWVRAFAGRPEAGRLNRTLLRLPGAEACAQRFGDEHLRCVSLPAVLLDDTPGDFA